MPDATAIIHSTNCHSYVVSITGKPDDDRVCRSLQEAYDLLRSQGVREAALAQRIPADEIAGARMESGLSYMPIRVPDRGP